LLPTSLEHCKALKKSVTRQALILVNYRQQKQAASETRHEPLPYLSVSRADPAGKIVSTLDGFDFTARPIRANRIPKFERARPAPESNQSFKGCVFWTCSERKSQDSASQEEGGASPAG
jgi:hypothetical protein